MPKHMVKCPTCGITFDANTEPYENFPNSKRYAHAGACADAYRKKLEKNKKKASCKKCYYCGKDVDIAVEDYRKPFKNRYAHVKCYEEGHSEDEQYVTEIYNFLRSINIKADGQTEKFRSNYVQKNGYTNEGIYYALKYFYEVQKHNADQSGCRLGIVPYVYDEAQVYYETLRKKKKSITKGLNKQLDKAPKVIKINGEEKQKDKGYLDLDSIGG